MVRRALIHLTPRWLGKLFYHLVYSVARRQLTQGPVEVWARHSYAQGYLVPFLSDLDLTVWITEEPNLQEVKRSYTRFQNLKNKFRILSEINCYPATQIQNYAKYVNPYELARDPILARRLENLPGYTAPSIQPFHKTVFLLRNIESDLDNLRDRPRLREKKWRHHLRALEIDQPRQIGLERLVELAVAQNPLETQPGLARDAILHYLEKLKPLPPDFVPPTDFYLWKYFPHRFSSKNIFPFSFPHADVGVLLAQVDWEIWGIFSQYLTFPFYRPGCYWELINQVISLQGLLKNTLPIEFVQPRYKQLTHLSELCFTVEPTLKKCFGKVF